MRHRSEVLADIVASGDGICVAGAHGKTSTTALIAYVLAECGEDPTFLVGGDVPQLGVNARVGSGRSSWPRPTSRTARSPACARARPWCSTPSSTITITSPRSTICTSSSGPGSPSCPPEGALVLHDSLDYASEAELRRFGAGPGEGWRALDVVPEGDGIRFVLAAPGRDAAAAAPGRARRAQRPQRDGRARAARLGGHQPGARGGAACGLPRRDAALRPQGRGRRASGWSTTTRIIRASSPRTLRRRAGEAGPGRLLACFQPHMPWRTRMFADGFASALPLADAACVCDVYVARGAADPEVTGELIVQSAQRQDPAFPIAWTPEYADAADWIARTARAGDLVLTLGAGPVDGVLGLVRERLG